MKGTAKALVSLRAAQVIQSSGADEFFPSLAEKVAALEEFGRPHPLSVQAAVASLKRFMSEDRYRIQLHELLAEEAANVRSAVEAVLKENGHPAQLFATSVTKIDAAIERFLHLLVVGTRYATERQARAFGDAFQTLASIPNSGNGFESMLALTRYPALLAVYAIGLASIAADEFHVLRDIAYRRTELNAYDDTTKATPERIHSAGVGERGAWNEYVFLKKQNWFVPVSVHLEDMFFKMFARSYPQREMFLRVFDGFEMLWGFLKVEAETDAGRHYWPSPGQFLYRHAWWETAFAKKVALVAEGKVPDWAPLKAGLFGGSTEKFKAAYEAARERYKDIRQFG